MKVLQVQVVKDLEVQETLEDQHQLQVQQTLTVQVAEVRAACQLADQIRAETAPAMRALASLGVATTMLTGDAEGTAQAVRAEAPPQRSQRQDQPPQ